MNIVIEYDDLHFLNPENCLDTIDALVWMYPEIKLSFFCPAGLRDRMLFEDKSFCDRLRTHIDNNNVRIGVHGFTHSIEEFKLTSYGIAHSKIKQAQEIFKASNIPYCKCFRGPHWGMSKESIDALSSFGYTHLYNHMDYIDLDNFAKSSGLKTIYYNWNLKDEFKEVGDSLIIAHGHTHDVCENGINETLGRLVSFIDDNNPTFLFIDEA